MHTKHVARKRFGQHFLHDKNIIQKIIDAIQPQVTDNMVEIGPGQGALTVPILKKTGKLTAIELDRDLIPALQARCADKGLLTIYQEDALQFDFKSLVTPGKSIRLIGNLPYNISTPLLFHLMDYAEVISDMHFMLQKEVVMRLAAKPNDEAYGRLSIMLQYHADIVALFDVPPEAFYPPPQVESSMIKIIPYQQKPLVAKDYGHFSLLVREAFSHRRKTLRNALKEVMHDADWEQSGFDAKRRPEELSVADFIQLSNFKMTH